MVEEILKNIDKRYLSVTQTDAGPAGKKPESASSSAWKRENEGTNTYKTLLNKKDIEE
jgi:hypothetical protein